MSIIKQRHQFINHSGHQIDTKCEGKGREIEGKENI